MWMEKIHVFCWEDPWCYLEPLFPFPCSWTNIKKISLCPCLQKPLERTGKRHCCFSHMQEDPGLAWNLLWCQLCREGLGRALGLLKKRWHRQCLCLVWAFHSESQEGLLRPVSLWLQRGSWGLNCFSFPTNPTCLTWWRSPTTTGPVLKVTTLALPFTQLMLFSRARRTTVPGPNTAWFGNKTWLEHCHTQL